MIYFLISVIVIEPLLLGLVAYFLFFKKTKVETPKIVVNKPTLVLPPKPPKKNPVLAVHPVAIYNSTESKPQIKNAGGYLIQANMTDEETELLKMFFEED